jgi:hypothetical protein
MGFGMTPATNWPVPTPDDFPEFIQFQADGTNLGGPDADTVNFSTGLTATRGEGESANVVTVIADGGGVGGDWPWIDVLLDHDGDFLAAMEAGIATGGSFSLFFRLKPGYSTYDVTGPVQDSGRGKAQVLFPSKHVLDDKQITVALIGEVAPPPIFSVVGGTSTPDQHVIIESSLESDGAAILGGWGPAGSYLDYTFVNVVIKNIAFRLPSNTNMTAVDLSHVCACDVDQVVVDASEYFVDDMVEPTHASSYGIKFPGRANGANTRVGLLGIIGYYTGFQTSEHFTGENIGVFGCIFPCEFTEADHASIIDRLDVVHCQHGPKWSGSHYLSILQHNIEKAQNSAPLWTQSVDDLYDPTNLGLGELVWHVVTGFTGVTHTYTKNGGKNIAVRELGNGADMSTWTAAQAAVSDETTALTAGAGKLAFRHVGRRYVREVRASLVSAQVSGSILTIDINVGGVSILSTKLTIDNGELTSTTAATAAVIIAGTMIPDDGLITIDIDQVGDGTAAGLKVTII